MKTQSYCIFAVSKTFDQKKFCRGVLAGVEHAIGHKPGQGHAGRMIRVGVFIEDVIIDTEAIKAAVEGKLIPPSVEGDFPNAIQQEEKSRAEARLV